MARSLTQVLFPNVTSDLGRPEKTIREMIRDIDQSIANEETVWSSLTDPLLIDSSILKIESLRKKRQSLHYEAVAEYQQLIG